jgi:hypothetical protein
MTDYGFRFLELRLVGPGMPPAVVEFSHGLNLIHGPSDTGKSFVFQCLDYALGAKSPPKGIPESSRYQRVQLIIERVDGGSTTRLTRSLQDGNTVEAQFLDAQLRPIGKGLVLNARHSGAKENTLSAYLLGLSGLKGKYVRKDKNGATRTLSFRDVARLVSVNEEEILREDSPIHSGRTTGRTVESSVFRLLLTGMDDSEVEAAESKEITQTRKEAKLELLDELMGELAHQLAAKNPSSADHGSNLALLDATEVEVREAHAALLHEQARVDEAELSRMNTWRKLREAESRLAVLSALADRFRLLGEQYRSDLSRLEATAEAGAVLENMPVEVCPVCGAEEQHQNPSHRAIHHDPAILAEACIAEITRIRVLNHDLEATLNRVAADIDMLRGLVETLSRRETAIAAEIHALLKPRTAQVMSAYHACVTRREELRAVADLHAKRSSLIEKRAAVEAMRAEVPAAEMIKKLVAAQASEFVRAVEELLRQWGYPDLGHVSYSEKSEDIVIAGRQRASHGKGLRALTHAAFTLGLFDYCRSGARPHPGFVILDSPLNPYKQKPVTDGGSVHQDVKAAFFRSVAHRFADSQVIVVENTEPPDDVSFRVIEFAGGGRGRAGFIPGEAPAPRSG